MRPKRKIARDFINDCKRKEKCVRCEYSNPNAFAYHHIDESTKLFAISDAAVLGKSIEQIKEEMMKCEVLCANCHLITHYERKIDNQAQWDDEEATYQEMILDEEL